MITLKQTFKLSILTLAVSSTIPAFAATKYDQAEIIQLRQEVKELRALIEQQQVSQRQNTVAITQLNETAKTQAMTKQPKPTLASGTEISFYGNVRFDASYQAEGSAADRLYNNINKVPLEGNGEASDRLKSTLSATRFGADLKSQLNGQDVSGKLEVDFLGGASLDSLRIRHAYMNYGNWLIGQTWSNFAIPDYMPETIDALGYVGGAVKRTPQVRYTHGFSPSTSLVFAAEDSKDSISKMRTPAITARLNHQINQDGRVSLRVMTDEKHTDEDKTLAWGVGLGVQYKLAPKTTLKADYYHVKGDGSFVSWANQGFSTNANGKILADNEFDSITVGLTQNINEKWRATLGFGYMEADVSDRYKEGTVNKIEVNKKLWQGWANAFYSPVKPLSFGIEYVYGERKAIIDAPSGSNTGIDNRVNAVAIYNF